MTLHDVVCLMHLHIGGSVFALFYWLRFFLLFWGEMKNTVFSQLNALGVYKFFRILGWALIGEGRLQETGYLIKKIRYLKKELLKLNMCVLNF